MRLFRKRRGGDGSNDDGGQPDSRDANRAAGPISAPFDEAVDTEQNENQLRFKHILMTNSGERRNTTTSNANASEGRSRGREPHERQRGQVDNNNNATTALPQRHQPRSSSNNTLEHAKASTTTAVAPHRQERSRQKLDHLSRQHQRHQRQRSSRVDGTMTVTVDTPNTLTGGGSAATTVDTSDTSPSQQHQRQHGSNTAQHNNSSSVVPPSSLLTRHLAAAACGMTNQTTASFESSTHYSKHDFHNLRRQYDADSSFMSDSYMHNDIVGKSNNIFPSPASQMEAGRVGQATQQQQQRNIQPHDNAYQPKPPQRRSGHSGSVGGGGQAAERRKASQQQQQMQSAVTPQRQQMQSAVTPSPPPPPPPPEPTPVDPPSSAVEAASSSAPTDKVINKSSSKLIGRLLGRQSRKMKDEGGEQKVVVPQQQQSRKKEVKFTDEPTEQQHRRQKPSPPDPPAIYRHMPSFVDQKPKNEPPGKYRHMPSFVNDPKKNNSGKEGRQHHRQHRAEKAVSAGGAPSQLANSHNKSNPSSSQLQQTTQLNVITRARSQPTQPVAKPTKSKELPPPSQLKSRSKSKQEAEWSTPLPFKKVNSTPSNFSSFFTSPSDVWEDVEEYSDNPRRELFPDDEDDQKKKSIGASREKRRDEYFDRGSAETKQKKDRIEVYRNANAKQKQRTREPKKRRSQRASPIDIASPRALSPLNEDDVSNAFSLKLPISRYGAFDDSDISALQMNDSATVYYQRTLNVGAVAAMDYWKKKYDRLKEETQAQVNTQKLLRGMYAGGESADANAGDEDRQQVELKEVIDNHNNGTTNTERAVGDGDMSYGSLGDTYDTLEDTVDGDNTQRTESLVDCEKRRRCASPFDAVNKMLEEVIMDNCEIVNPSQKQGSLQRQQQGGGDYYGGKKGRDRKQREPEEEPTQNKCSPGRGIPKEELDYIMNQAEKTREMSVHKMKKTAKEMLQFVSKLEEGGNAKGDTNNAVDTSFETDDVVPHCKSFCSSKMRSPDDFLSPGQDEEENVVRPSKESLSPETNDSDGQNLRPIGYVSRESPQHVMEEGEEEEGGNDVELMQQWNKTRSTKRSLADDLTAGASHISPPPPASSTTDGSELSENVKEIFEALKYDVKALRGQRGRALRSPSPAIEEDAFGSSNIPDDFATWFELPSPGSTCIPLLPLLDIQLRNYVDVTDSTDVPPQYRADDVVDLSFSDFARTFMGREGREVDIDHVKESMGSVVANMDTGSMHFANPSVHLPGISDAAIAAISRRQFEDAVEIYNTLLRSCQAYEGPKLGLVGQLIASTLYNLSVLHLWDQQYEAALPYCREALRIKGEIEGDDAGGCINLWANLGLINYAMESFPSALAAFRKAVQMSSGQITGRLVNNMACVNYEIGKLPLVQSQFKQSLQIQKGDEANVSAAEDLFSISVTIFNVGITCARQGQTVTAMSHLKASLAIQQALFEKENEVVQSTVYYLESLKKIGAPTASLPQTKALSLKREANPVANQPTAQPNEPAAPRIDGHEKTAPQEENKKTVDNAPSESASPQAQQGQVEHISYPMLSLGSLRAEATVAQRVQRSLEGSADSLTPQISGGRGSLLCRRPPRPNVTPTPKKRTISQIVVQSMKKRELQADLQFNLQRYGLRHPSVGESHNRLGVFHLFAQNYCEAIDHFITSIRINTNALGDKYPDVANALMLKALAELAAERLDESMSTMLQVRRLRIDALGPQHPEIGQIMNNMACVQYELGNYKKAESLLQEALDLQREVFTTESSFLTGVSIVLCNIAFLHAKNGSFPKALIELEGALQIRQDILLEDNSSNDITENMAYVMAVHQLQHGAVSLDDVTEEYLTMLRSEKARKT